MIKKAAIGIAMFALIGVGCGGDSGSSSKISYEPWDLPKVGSVADRQERRARDFLEPTKNGLIGSELKPIIPDRPPPEFLYVLDLIDSFSMPVADNRDRVTVQYVGAVYDSKEKFASSWDEGKPFTFILGRGEVIEGWEEGLQRLEIGDRRELVVPPDLVTGGTRMGNLPQGETLVFILEALDVKEFP
ncbi:MAG TPA: FKBP-type peptidyl-prolyl cis-trans isomerase [Solirubrobacterales bacterium]|nr:FKBP-type peptidyl-prolyl cis-trans isomerase [Solirubrobacterales bacterium]